MIPYYDHEGITIYHGDCREFLPYLSADLTVTDPPYNIGKKYGEGTNDNREPKEYWTWFSDIFTQVFASMGNGYLYMSHSDKGAYQAKPELERIGFDYVQTLIWWGRNGYSMQLHRTSWSYRHEPILFMSKGEKRELVAGEKGMWYTSVIEVPRPQSNFSEGREHPTQKPVKLYTTLIQRTPGDIVLDPFMGSGSVLRAAKNMNRKAIGIEIEEQYCEVAAKRLSQSVMNLEQL